MRRTRARSSYISATPAVPRRSRHRGHTHFWLCTKVRWNASGANERQAVELRAPRPTLQGERGRPRHRPDCVLGDRGYDAEAIRQGLRARHVVPWLARRNTADVTGEICTRWNERESTWR